MFLLCFGTAEGPIVSLTHDALTGKCATVCKQRLVNIFFLYCTM